jgi:hypothetical protein
LLSQRSVILAQAFDCCFELGDSRHELLRIAAQQIKALKRSLTQLLALEGQRAELSFDDRFLAVPGNQIALDYAAACEFEADQTSCGAGR